MLELDQNYLDWYFRLLTIFGMWNPFDKFDVKSNIYVFYAIILFCLAGITPSTGEIIHAWKNSNDIVMFTQHFTMVTAMVSTMAKIINIWHCKSDIEIATNLLNWERRQPCNRNFAVYRDEIIISTIRACRLFSLTFITMVLWYCSFSYGKDFIYHKGEMNKLSIGPLLCFRSNETLAYWVMFCMDKTTVSYLAGCTACHDSFFMVLLMHVSAQLDLLKRRLESCQDKIDKHADYIEKDYNMYDLKVECVCRTNMQEIYLDRIVELHTCIKHHQQILRYVNLVQGIFNVTLLLQFVTSLLIITMVGFQILGERELNRHEMIDSMNFLICAVFQLFLYCWFGTDIIAKVISKCYSSMALLKQVNE